MGDRHLSRMEILVLHGHVDITTIDYIQKKEECFTGFVHSQKVFLGDFSAIASRGSARFAFLFLGRIKLMWA